MYLVFEVFQDTWRSNKDNPCLLSLDGLKIVSRSDLVLELTVSLDFLGWQLPISFTGVHLFFRVCSHKNAVAHMVLLGLFGLASRSRFFPSDTVEKLD